MTEKSYWQRNKLGQFVAQKKAYSNKDIGTVLLHMLDGFLIAYLVTSGNVGLILIGLMIFVGFMVYEIVEDWRIKDRSYRDIFGCLLGLGIYAIYPVAVMLWERYHLPPL